MQSVSPLRVVIDALQVCATSSAELSEIRKVLESYLRKVRPDSDVENVEFVIAYLAGQALFPQKLLSYLCFSFRTEADLQSLLETYINVEADRPGAKRSITGYGMIVEALLTAYQAITKVESSGGSESSKEADAAQRSVSSPSISVDRNTLIASVQWDYLLGAARDRGFPEESDIIDTCIFYTSNSSMMAERPFWVTLEETETLQSLALPGGGDQASLRDLDREIINRLQEQEIEQSFVEPAADKTDTGREISEVKRSEEEFQKQIPLVEDMVNVYAATATGEELLSLRAMAGRSDPKLRKEFEEELELLEKIGPSIERAWGPANASLGRNCPSSGQRRGPCRMLSCCCREEFEDEITEESRSSWFTGSCESCLLQIGDISYAVRFPVTGGGWVGCFCSFECMARNPPRSVYLEEQEAIKRIQANLKRFGIMDRQAAAHNPIVESKRTSTLPSISEVAGD